MYNASGAAAAGGTLAFTGALAVGQYVVAALALIAVGAVLVRLAPRRTRG